MSYGFRVMLLIFCMPSYCAMAHPVTISGKVSDEHGKPVVYANVMLFKAQDTTTLIKADFTNDNGQYKFSAADSETYVLKVALLGYDLYRSESFSAADDIMLPDIKLVQKGNELKEASIVAQKPLIEVHPDKLVVNVENSIVNAGSSAMDILSRSPGVTVDQNDNISLKGKQGVTIMMDGKIVPISGTDLANLLKSMPSNSIASIELISNPSAKYDAAGSAGIINIKTKKDKNTGFNGSVNGSYAQGVYPKASGGFNLNYRNSKLNVFANYNNSYREGFNELVLTRNFYTNDAFIGGYQQNYNTIYPFKSNLGSVGMDYNVSSKTVIGFTANGTINDFAPHGYDATAVKGVDQNDSSLFSTTNNSQDKYYNYALNLNLRHTFDTTGTELTVDADYARYWNQSYQNFNTDYYDLAGMPTLPPYLLYGDITGITQIRSLKADYVHPFKHNMRIEAGFKSSYITADNQPKYFDRSNGGNVFDSGISDHFVYTENINAAYVTVSKSWKKWDAQLGLRAEQTIITGDEKITDSTFKRNYIQPFPSFAIQDHVNANNDLGLSLSRRIDRPSYQQLTPFKFFLDPTNYKDGNPYLNPALSYNMELSYTYKQKFITTFTYARTNNVIIEVIQPISVVNKVSIQTDENLALNAYYDISGAYTLQFFKWWNNVTNFDAFYSQYKGDLANTNLDKGKPAGDITTTNSFLMPKDWSAEASLFYQTPQLYGYMNLTSAWMLSAGLQKKLFHKTATLRLNVTDIFRKGSVNGVSSYSNYVENFLVKRDTRQVSVAFTYHFGNSKLGQMQRHSRGDEDEIKRAGAPTT